MTKRNFTVSTDSAFYNIPSDIAAIYGHFATKTFGFGGVEVLGWWYLPYFLRQAKREGLPVIGIHGRVGPKHGPALSVVNQLFIDTPNLTRLVKQENLEYLLLHVPEVLSNFEFLKKSPVSIRIEGVTNPAGGIEMALKLVKQLKEHNVNAILNPDLAHIYLEKNQLPINSQKAVEFTMDFISKVSKDTQIAIHLPIGEDVTDSLNVFEVQGSTWKSFGQLLDNIPGVKLVIENQWKHSIVLNKKSKITYRDATIAKMEFLAEQGVI